MANALQQALASGQNYFDLMAGKAPVAATSAAALPAPQAAPTNVASYLKNDLYGGILGRQEDKGGYDFWMNAATKNNWTTDKLKEEFVKGAQPELQVKSMIEGLKQAPTAANTNVPMYQSTPVPGYTNYVSPEFKFEADPGYAFRKAEGEKALQARQLASGNFFSGGALKEATDFNSGLASQEYGNAFNRYLSKDAADFGKHIGNYNASIGAWSAADNAGFRNNNAAYDRQWNTDQRDYARWVDDFNRKTMVDNTNWDRLTYLDRAGLSAAGVGVNAGQSTAGNIGNLLVNGGNAQAGGIINGNNAWTNALGNALYGLRGGF